ncbi:MAG: hypothetical protein QXD43_01145 [Candidatus Aenigmatarchaeota archaeon]
MHGQTAVEYLMLFSLVFAILSLLTYYAQEMTERNREEIIISNAIIAANKIAEAADIVYTQGEPSQITLSVYIPENVQAIEFSNKMIILKIKVASGINDVFAASKAPFDLTSFISTTSGTKRIKVKAEGGYVKVTES